MILLIINTLQVQGWAQVSQLYLYPEPHVAPDCIQKHRIVQVNIYRTDSIYNYSKGESLYAVRYFDGAGRMSKEVYYLNDLDTTVDFEIRYSYDLKGRPVEIQWQWYGLMADLFTYRYEYKGKKLKRMLTFSGFELNPDTENRLKYGIFGQVKAISGDKEYLSFQKKGRYTYEFTDGDSTAVYYKGVLIKKMDRENGDIQTFLYGAGGELLEVGEFSFDHRPISQTNYQYKEGLPVNGCFRLHDNSEITADRYVWMMIGSGGELKEVFEAMD